MVKGATAPCLPGRYLSFDCLSVRKLLFCYCEAQRTKRLGEK